MFLGAHEGMAIRFKGEPDTRGNLPCNITPTGTMSAIASLQKPCYARPSAKTREVSNSAIPHRKRLVNCGASAVRSSEIDESLIKLELGQRAASSCEAGVHPGG